MRATIVAVMLIMSASRLGAQSATRVSSQAQSKIEPAAASAANAASGNVENGKRLFLRNGCYSCHGTLAHGGGGGAQLGPNALPFEAFRAYVRHPSGEMGLAPYSDKVVSDQELADIYAYVKSVPPGPEPKAVPLLNSK